MITELVEYCQLVSSSSWISAWSALECGRSCCSLQSRIQIQRPVRTIALGHNAHTHIVTGGQSSRIQIPFEPRIITVLDRTVPNATHSGVRSPDSVCTSSVQLIPLLISSQTHQQRIPSRSLLTNAEPYLATTVESYGN